MYRIRCHGRLDMVVFAYRRGPQQGMFKPYYKSASTAEHADTDKPAGYEQKMDMDPLSPVTDPSPEAEGFLSSESFLDGYCQVIHSYYPQSDDEVQLSKGDITRLIYSFDDGWALGKCLICYQVIGFRCC
jgi:hypothetical protein